jgi:hypothetical protein
MKIKELIGGAEMHGNIRRVLSVVLGMLILTVALSSCVKQEEPTGGSGENFETSDYNIILDVDMRASGTDSTATLFVRIFDASGTVVAGVPQEVLSLNADTGEFTLKTPIITTDSDGYPSLSFSDTAFKPQIGKSYSLYVYIDGNSDGMLDSDYDYGFFKKVVPTGSQDEMVLINASNASVLIEQPFNATATGVDNGTMLMCSFIAAGVHNGKPDEYWVLGNSFGIDNSGNGGTNATFFNGSAQTNVYNRVIPGAPYDYGCFAFGTESVWMKEGSISSVDGSTINVTLSTDFRTGSRSQGRNTSKYISIQKF